MAKKSKAWDKLFDAQINALNPDHQEKAAAKRDQRVQRMGIAKRFNEPALDKALERSQQALDLEPGPVQAAALAISGISMYSEMVTAAVLNLQQMGIKPTPALVDEQVDKMIAQQAAFAVQQQQQQPPAQS